MIFLGNNILVWKFLQQKLRPEAKWREKCQGKPDFVFSLPFPFFPPHKGISC